MSRTFALGWPSNISVSIKLGRICWLSYNFSVTKYQWVKPDDIDAVILQILEGFHRTRSSSRPLKSSPVALFAIIGYLHIVEGIRSLINK